MRAILIGLVTAGTLFAALPASAQGVRFNAPGVEVDVGTPRHRDRVYRERNYYRFRGERSYNRGGCRTVTIHRDDGVTRQIRRCDY
jgi:hypothetical protein